MSRKLHIALLCGALMLAIAGCGSGTTQYSETQYRIIDKDTMILIMAECYIAEGEIFYAPEDSDKQAVCAQLYSNIFHKHGITKEEYIANTDYYMKKKDESEIMMQAVMSKVEEKRKTLNESE